MEAKEKTMTSAEIVDIIRACSRNHVRSFKMGELHIQFDEPAEIASSPKKRSKRSSPASESPLDPSKTPEQLSLEEIEAIAAEFEQGQLSLTDPSAFEAQQLEGDSDEAT